MDDKITYGVFYRSKFNPDEWCIFSAWFESYEEARKEKRTARANTRFLEVRIVERVETFSFVG